MTAVSGSDWFYHFVQYPTKSQRNHQKFAQQPINQQNNQTCAPTSAFATITRQLQQISNNNPTTITTPFKQHSESRSNGMKGMKGIQGTELVAHAGLNLASLLNVLLGHLAIIDVALETSSYSCHGDGTTFPKAAGKCCNGETGKPTTS